jgi:hypothetical protein
MFSQLISVGRLFSTHAFVPARVQRQYVWDVSQCELFHNDLKDAFEKDPHASYYLGPIILAEDDASERIWVYDGQQRLTTLTIYFAALSQCSQGIIQRRTAALSKVQVGEEFRPRIDLQTRGGALTRIARQTNRTPNSRQNMPVDWRIYENERLFVKEFKDYPRLSDFAGWLQKQVLLNVLWARNEAGLTLFDRANNRGIRLHWYELVKSVITDGLGADFSPQPGKKIGEFWYETERETTHEFPDLIANAAFIRYAKMDAAGALAGFEDDFASERGSQAVTETGRELFGQLKFWRQTSMKLLQVRQYQQHVTTEADLIRLQLLFLRYPHWKSLLMCAEENPMSAQEHVSFLRELRRAAYVVHLLRWPSRPQTLDALFAKAVHRLRNNFLAGRPASDTIFPFSDQQLAQARGELNSSMTDDTHYGPIVKLCEAQLAFAEGVLDGHAHFLAQVEHILPRAARESWDSAFPDENERADLKSRLGNLCLLSKEDNFRASNDSWTLKQGIYNSAAPCFTGARAVAGNRQWTPELVRIRTGAIADKIITLLSLQA